MAWASMEYLWTWEDVPLSRVMMHGPLWALDSCLTVQHDYFLKPYSIFHSCLRFCSLSILLILFRCSLWTATLSPEVSLWPFLLPSLTTDSQPS